MEVPPREVAATGTAPTRSAVSWIGHVIAGLSVLCAGYGVAQILPLGGALPSPVEVRAEILGPKSIDRAGQLALFRASVPGKDPAALIHTWHVESLDGHSTTEVLATENAGEVQLLTVAGRWRLCVAVTDPAKRSGQMLCREVIVPGDPLPQPIPPVPPEPRPTPAPMPAPTPGPPMPAPPPQPLANRFSDLTTGCRRWLLDVTSPNRALEAAALRSGALAIVTRLKTGDLSTSTGQTLESSVIRALQVSNSEAIRANTGAWKTFASKVGTYAGLALANKRLTTAADWAELLTAFADGLSG